MKRGDEQSANVSSILISVLRTQLIFMFVAVICKDNYTNGTVVALDNYD